MMIPHKNTDPRNLMWLPIGRRGEHISSNGCFCVYMRSFDWLMSYVSTSIVWGTFYCGWSNDVDDFDACEMRTRGNMILVTLRIMKSSEHILAAGAHFVDNNLEQSRCLRNILNLSQRSRLRKIHPLLTFKMSSLPLGLIFDDSLVILLFFCMEFLVALYGIFGSLLMWEFNNGDSLLKSFC